MPFMPDPARSPAPLAMAIALALGALAPLAAQAQDTADKPITVNIGAQPLAQALNQLATQAGLQLIVHPDAVAGQTAPAVSGQLTARQAIMQLLGGSGLSADFDGTSVVVRPPPADTSGAALLPAVNVSASAGGLVTEGSGSYTAQAMTVASKMDMSLKETPRSISVITHQQLKDQGLDGQNMVDVLRYTPGITLDDTVLNSAQPQIGIYSRGQRVTHFQIDGMTMELGRASSNLPGGEGTTAGDPTGMLGLPDMAIFDHVEVVRGPNSLFAGNGTPSATVSLVRKRPQAHRQLLVDASYGLWQGDLENRGYWRTSLDATGPLTADGRLRGRALFSQRDGAGSFGEHHDDDTHTVFGALEYDLTDRTVIGGGISREKRQEDGMSNTTGLPRYLGGSDIGLPVDIALSSRHSYVSNDTTTVWGYLEQKLGEDWRLKLSANRSDQDYERWASHFASANIYENDSGLRIGNSNSVYPRNTRSTNVDLNLTGTFELLNRRHQLLIGGDYKDTDGRMGGPYHRVPAPQTYEVADIRHPDYAQLDRPVFAAEDLTSYAERKEYGIYATLKLQLLDPLHFLVSGRQAHYEHLDTGFIAPGAPKQPQTSWASGGYSADKRIPFSPTYALTLDLTPQWTSYVSYSKSYQDQSSYWSGNPDHGWASVAEGLLSEKELQTTNDPGKRMDPAIGRNIELGIKGELFEQRLNVAATLYRMKRTNLASRAYMLGGPYWEAGFDRERALDFAALTGSGSCCYRTGGEQLSKGLDLELSGEVYPGVQVSAGYTFNKNETKTALRPGAYGGPNVADGMNYTVGEPSHTRTPRHLLKLWSSYQPGGEWRKWNFGLGVVAQSKAYTSGTVPEYLGEDPDREHYNLDGELFAVGNSVWSNDSYYTTGDGKDLGYNPRGVTYTLPYAFTQGVYGVWNMAVGYQLDRHWHLQLNVDNLFDKRYYRTIGTSTGGNYYGAPRYLSLTLRATFD